MNPVSKLDQYRRGEVMLVIAGVMSTDSAGAAFIEAGFSHAQGGHGRQRKRLSLMNKMSSSRSIKGHAQAGNPG